MIRTRFIDWLCIGYPGGNVTKDSEEGRESQARPELWKGQQRAARNSLDEKLNLGCRYRTLKNSGKL